MKESLQGALKSATVWFNTVVLAAIPALEYAKEVLPDIQLYLGADSYKLAGLVILIANIALRFKTTKPLAEK